MVAADGLGPAIGLGAQVGQELRGIGHVEGRIEGLGQGLEGIGMEMQIDLHAAHVDVPHPARLQRLHFRDGGGLGRQITPLALGHDGPGPGKMCLAVAVPAPRLGPRQGGQQVLGKTQKLLGRRDVAAAEIPGRQRLSGPNSPRIVRFRRFEAAPGRAGQQVCGKAQDQRQKAATDRRSDLSSSLRLNLRLNSRQGARQGAEERAEHGSLPNRGSNRRSFLSNRRASFRQ